MENLAVQQEGSFKRATAVKVRLADLNQGSWQEKFLEIRNGEKISRARVLATVVGKFVSDDGKFGSVTLDDATDTIRAKTWDNLKLMEKVAIGDIVDLIGKVREYSQEIYLVPEIVRKVEDPNFEMLRKLELIEKYGPLEAGKKEKAETKLDKLDLKKQILKLIEEKTDGISYPEILEKIKAPQAEVEDVINDLLSGGLCWEPSPGIIKKI